MFKVEGNGFNKSVLHYHELYGPDIKKCLQILF